jgi:hypothetical protein
MTTTKYDQVESRMVKYRYSDLLRIKKGLEESCYWNESVTNGYYTCAPRHDIKINARFYREETPLGFIFHFHVTNDERRKLLKQINLIPEIQDLINQENNIINNKIINNKINVNK